MDITQIQDPKVRQMLVERGIQTGITYPSTSREYHTEQAILGEVMQQRQHQREFEMQQQAQQQQHQDTAAARGVAQSQLDLYREAQTQAQKTREEETRQANTEELLKNPQLLDTTYGKGAGTAVSKAVLDKRLASSGVGPISIPADAAKVALAQASQNEKDPSRRIPIPQPTVIGGAPAAPTAPAEGGQQAPQLPFASPQDLSPGPGASPARAERAFALQQAVNRGEATTGGGPAGSWQVARDAGQPYVEGGFVHNQPAGTAGMDLNVNTGEWMPSNLVGTIGGRNAGVVNAEGALRHGHTPESASGRAAYPGVKAAQEEAQTANIPSLPESEATVAREGEASQQMNFGDITTHPNAAGVPSATTTHISGPNVQPQAAPTPAPFGSGAMSSGTRSGEWLGRQISEPFSALVGQPTMQALQNVQRSTGQLQPQPKKKPTPEQQRLAGQ